MGTILDACREYLEENKSPKEVNNTVEFIKKTTVDVYKFENEQRFMSCSFYIEQTASKQARFIIRLDSKICHRFFCSCGDLREFIIKNEMHPLVDSMVKDEMTGMYIHTHLQPFWDEFVEVLKWEIN